MRHYFSSHLFTILLVLTVFSSVALSDDTDPHGWKVTVPQNLWTAEKGYQPDVSKVQISVWKEFWSREGVSFRVIGNASHVEYDAKQQGTAMDVSELTRRRRSPSQQTFTFKETGTYVIDLSDPDRWAQTALLSSGEFDVSKSDCKKKGD
ncbi:hypothetical protein T439DRAFT_334541 [Meredithblackwellia eburnea MCA 4105]